MSVGLQRRCVACDSPMQRRIKTWLWRCPACGFWASDLGTGGPCINPATPVIQEKREPAMLALRMEGHHRCLDVLQRFGTLRGMRLLDVGCAQGWFLSAAESRGMAVLGLEPEDSVAQAAVAAGRQVRIGFFPDAIGDSELFDVITFNDVLEHLHDLPRVLQHCHRLLRPQGRILLSIPDSRGFFFRIACRLAGCGWSGPLDRMWQVGYNTPHLSYFHAENLARLLASAGFERRYSGALPSISRVGLWDRIHIDRAKPSLSSRLQFAAIWLCAPVLRHGLHSDQLVQVYQKVDRAIAAGGGRLSQVNTPNWS